MTNANSVRSSWFINSFAPLGKYNDFWNFESDSSDLVNSNVLHTDFGVGASVADLESI